MENKLFSILRGFGKIRFRLRFYSISFYLSFLDWNLTLFLYTILSCLHLIEFRNFYRKLRVQNWICVDYNQVINMDQMNTATTATSTSTPTSTPPTTIMRNKHVLFSDRIKKSHPFSSFCADEQCHHL